MAFKHNGLPLAAVLLQLCWVPGLLVQAAPPVRCVQGAKPPTPTLKVVANTLGYGKYAGIVLEIRNPGAYNPKMGCIGEIGLTYTLPTGNMTSWPGHALMLVEGRYVPWCPKDGVYSEGCKGWFKWRFPAVVCNPCRYYFTTLRGTKVTFKIRAAAVASVDDQGFGKEGPPYSDAGTLVVTAAGAAVANPAMHNYSKDEPMYQYVAVPNANTPGNDLDCGQKDAAGKPIPFCKICGGVVAVAKKCGGYTWCSSFDMEPNMQCGYVKVPDDYTENYRVAPTIHAPGWTTFVKSGWEELPLPKTEPRI